MKSLPLLPILLFSAAASAQRASHTGCVTSMADEPKIFTMSEAGTCYVLSGKEATSRLAGHIVVLSGPLAPATSAAPATLSVERVQKVGETCSETCTPEPPGHRGLSKREQPGSQGGTPGHTDPNQ